MSRQRQKQLVIPPTKYFVDKVLMKNVSGTFRALLLRYVAAKSCLSLEGSELRDLPTSSLPQLRCVARTVRTNRKAATHHRVGFGRVGWD